MVLHIEPAAIEINASPAYVRDIVLDFANMPTWHSKHFVSIAVKGSSKNPKDLVKGDKLEVKLVLGNLSFTPEVLENTPERFRWRGSAPLLFTGDHFFEFHPSLTYPGGTRFVHYEDFSGLFAHTMQPERKSGAQNLDGFIAFNEDLKRKCESKTEAETGTGA